VPTFKKSEQKECVKDPKYVVEAIKEAVKQEGRFSSICISGGSIISGEKPFDDEVNGYIDLLQRIGTVFGDEKRFPSQLVASAFDNEQLERLYENTGLTSYTADLEVLDAEKFAWICPGKSEFIGFDEWKRRLYYATEVFGRGNVNTGCVLGVELAKPNGFATEDEAFSRVSETIEDLVSHGVAIAGNIWCAAPNSIFQRQDTPSLDYYVRVCRYINQLHHQYEINPFIDDYKRCGMHPVMDLLRI